ncbi:hypothetical protein [Dyadobacter aurulentus]|uniref:hypothetical protein n=1 Tax=Dyadobacter sp. UC 10 TaxID=2605428 RepID=UPI0011F1F7FB|nr:hypothetical protein [Dyadobacter sp. UC 10]KAA0992832.1 hypothetical protein FXO21_22975 [Dyadobacter sp. UC 10]
MHQNPYYRQEYICLLREHSQEITRQSANFQEQRKALKLLHKEQINTGDNGPGFLKRIFIQMRHIREMRTLNERIEAKLASIKSAQQNEIHDLKSSWQLRHTLNDAN